MDMTSAQLRTVPLAIALIALFGAGCAGITAQFSPTAGSSGKNSSQGQTPKVLERSENTNEPLGYIKRVYQDNGRTYIDLDEAQMMTGYDGARAMFADTDGDCPSGVDDTTSSACMTDDGYYIRNNSTSTMSLELAPSAVFNVVSSTIAGPKPIPLKSFAAFQHYLDGVQAVISNSAPAPDTHGVYTFGPPFHVTLKDGVVVKLEEQYLP